MKIIDLLNKIANGEEVPKKIKYRDDIWLFEDDTYLRKDLTPNFDDSYRKYLLGFYNFNILNDEVEILEEEKKIPEKLEIEIEMTNNFYIRNENGTKCYLTKHSKMIVETLNQVIDYLESKGE